MPLILFYALTLAKYKKMMWMKLVCSEYDRVNITFASTAYPGDITGSAQTTAIKQILQCSELRKLIGFQVEKLCLHYIVVF